MIGYSNVLSVEGHLSHSRLDDPKRAFAFLLVYARVYARNSSRTKILEQEKDKREGRVKRGEREVSSEPPVPKKIYYDYDARTWRGIKQSDLDFWADDFDGLDVMAELRKMKAWLDSHPKKKDFKRFIANWFLRGQTRSTTFAGGKGPRVSHR